MPGRDESDADESVDLDGGFGVVWTRSVGDLHPLVAQDGLLLLAGPGRLALLEADTGFELWEIDVPGEHPAAVEIDGDVVHYLVEYRHLVIDIDAGEILEERALDTHAGERSDALPARPTTQVDDFYWSDLGRFQIAVQHAGLGIWATKGEPFAAVISVHRHHAHWPAVLDPDVAAAYVALPDGSLWCFSTDGSGVPVEPGDRTRATALVELVDALHVRGTDELGLRARLAAVSADVAAAAVLDWAVGTASLGLRAGGFPDEADQLIEIGSLADWDLLPEEASAVGEVLSAPWEDDLDRRAGEEAAVIWTLVASALAGGHAVQSRAVLLVERSRVLASHPSELPLHEVGGAYPYLTAGTEDMDDAARREIERVSLGLLAAACVARCADLAPDPDDLLNDVRAAGFEVVAALLDSG